MHERQLVNMHVQRVLAERQSRVEHLREQLRLEEQAAAALTSANAVLRRQLAPLSAPEVGMLHRNLQTLILQPGSQSRKAVTCNALCCL